MIATHIVFLQRNISNPVALAFQFPPAAVHLYGTNTHSTSLTLTSTIPITCGCCPNLQAANAKCPFTVEIVSRHVGVSGQQEADVCEYVLHKDKESMNISLSARPKPTAVTDIVAEYIVEFQAIDLSAYGDADLIWNEYQLPPIQVSVLTPF